MCVDKVDRATQDCRIEIQISNRVCIYWFQKKKVFRVRFEWLDFQGYTNVLQFEMFVQEWFLILQSMCATLECPVLHKWCKRGPMEVRGLSRQPVEMRRSSPNRFVVELRFHHSSKWTHRSALSPEFASIDLSNLTYTSSITWLIE